MEGVDRRLRLQTIKLLGRCVRIGTSRTSGPIFFLDAFDHTRDTFVTINVHTQQSSKYGLDDLAQAIDDGIAHVSRITGNIYLA